MITPAEALPLIEQNLRVPAPESASLIDAAGRYLASDIEAPVQLPLFDNSAMDGYAIISSDVAEASEDNPVSINVRGTVAAGDASVNTVTAGQAMQIFTGAKVMPGADAVIPQEDVFRSESGDTIIIERPVVAGAHIRRAGEEVHKGDIILRAGDCLTPAAIGLLACLGVDKVQVFPRPRVGCIITGSELCPPGTPLREGMIYDSNSSMLMAAVKQTGVSIVFDRQTLDDFAALSTVLQQALSVSNVVLLTGGVSVGQFDYVRAAAVKAGVDEVFWRIAQKPGKPLYFGATPDRSKAVFGLPGNPASVLTCFYEYVAPALRQLMGAGNSRAMTLSATLKTPFSRRGSLTQFLKGDLNDDGTVSILEHQGSHMLSSYARANCLVVIPPDENHLQEGAKVQVHLIP